MNYFTFRHPFLLTTVALFLINICIPSFADGQELESASVQKKLMELESASGGRVGISAVNTANNQWIQYRAEERFPFQSTFKVIGVSAILKQSMTDSHLLQQKVTYKKQDLVFWSPITEKHVMNGMTVFDLCAATIIYSDNTAINLLVKKLGGPEAVNVFTHSMGDNTTRLDGWEAELNSNPNELRDTSTPSAMEKNLQQLALGDILASPQREQLVNWMKGNTTGDKRIRAGVPKGWIVADKTGSGDYGITNDIGVIWPPKCAPIVVAMYFVQNTKYAARRDDIIASATRILIDEFAKTDQCVKSSY